MTKPNEPPAGELAHYGVKGMKWGVRKSDPSGKPEVKERTESRTVKLKNGDTLTLDGNRTPAMSKFLARRFSGVREKINNTSSFQIKDKNDNVVGELETFKESPSSLNVVWVGVNDKHRGKGYASAVMKSVVDHAKRQKLKTVTLEVPGNSPDARHIYEKLGFREDKKLSTYDPVWGGLTAMRLNLDDEIKHYGVKGMKWGVRKANPKDAPNKRYSEGKRELDRQTFGRRGEKRINRRMNAGKTHKQAARRELGLSIAKSTATVALGSAFLAGDLMGYSTRGIAKRAETKRGQAAMANGMGLPRRGSSINYAKQRRGAYNISSL